MIDDQTEKSIEENTQKAISKAVELNERMRKLMDEPPDDEVKKMKKDWTESEQADNMANLFER